ncbi:MAG: dephospho-CoA kinase [Alphaproteobacteria bacterium]|nr:dephospho-CoA kinase [Alphaproteobacteria bacterium]
MKLVGITGSIGCGKTTLAKILKKLGYTVFDIDAWVRRIYHNKDFLHKLEKEFCGSVKNGIADKKYLRGIVFKDFEKLKLLEGLIHPFLNAKIRNVVTKYAKNDIICFLDAALLFEKGWNKYCDIIILADVDYEIQKNRVMKRDNITADDFDRINNVQIKNSDKKLLSDIVINTDKSINLLKVELIEILKKLEQI